MAPTEYSHFSALWQMFALVNSLLIASSITALVTPPPCSRVYTTSTAFPSAYDTLYCKADSPPPPPPCLSDRPAMPQETAWWACKAYGYLWSITLWANIVAMVLSVVMLGELLALRHPAAVRQFLFKRVFKGLRTYHEPGLATAFGAFVFFVSSLVTAFAWYGPEVGGVTCAGFAFAVMPLWRLVVEMGRAIWEYAPSPSNVRTSLSNSWNRLRR